LESAERRIELLSGVDAEGNPITKPFDEGDVETIEGKAASRGARRTSTSKSTSMKITLRDDDMDDPPRLF
ncbi:MAG TPA: exodeoxyribonuclease VII, partial [Lacipirellulaceae bacterium]|nr:exodeoxyribonuclease VII [Lacipirellulaceae bacterium]